jgi:hexosaminidase
LCNATHLYFDLACEKDPLEPGYYWAGFVDTRKPFEFVPLDVFQNAHRNSMGQPVSAESLAGRTRLTDDGKRHVLGIQGQLWGENLRDARALEYMAFPRLIALAERAWASPPAWAIIGDRTSRQQQLDRDWNQFANRLGQLELPRLDWLHGGVNYRLPPPGAIVRDGLVTANVAFPGMSIRYSDDGSEPNENSKLFDQPTEMERQIKLKTFDRRGRGSRTVELK